MARPSTSPEKLLAAQAHRIGVLVYYSEKLKAKCEPHIRLFSRGVCVAELPTVSAARDWLGLRDGLSNR